MALSDLNSNDKRLETNKKMREAYRMKKDVTKGAKISSDLNFKDGAAEEHAHISGTVQFLPTNGNLPVMQFLCSTLSELNYMSSLE